MVTGDVFTVAVVTGAEVGVGAVGVGAVARSPVGCDGWLERPLVG